jgi:hypothetical protein
VLTLKLVLHVLAVLMAILVALLDYRWSDKRTRRFKNTRTVLFILLIISLLLSVGVVVRDDRDKRAELITLQQALADLRIQGARADEAADQRGRQQAQQLEEIKQQLAPFLAIANERYPNSTTSDALHKLATEVKAIQGKTALLEERSLPRSISNQARISAASVLKAESGQEVSVSSVWGDQEALQLALEIKGIFESSGWKVLGVYNVGYSVPVLGILMSTGKAQETAKLVSVVHALRAMDFDPKAVFDSNIPAERVDILVGTKK